MIISALTQFTQIQYTSEFFSSEKVLNNICGNQISKDDVSDGVNEGTNEICI